MSAISVKDLKKKYGDFEAVKGISFEVPNGSFFAFLGPNGAGKSTTISILCSLLSYESGEVLILDKSPSDARSDIGVVFQEHMLDDRLTVRENIAMRGAMYNLKDKDLESAVSKAIEITDSTSFADRKYGQLSGGQKRRADIARALVHNPKLLILDEPTSGLDPQSRKSIWNTIFELNRKSGMTVLLTTHYMEEAAEADDVVIINHGEIVAHGTPSQLKDYYCVDTLKMVATDPQTMKQKLNDLAIDFEYVAGEFRIVVNTTKDAIPILESVKDFVDTFEVKSGTLDDAFISITGEGEK